MNEFEGIKVCSRQQQKATIESRQFLKGCAASIHASRRVLMILAVEQKEQVFKRDKHCRKRCSLSPPTRFMTIYGRSLSADLQSQNRQTCQWHASTIYILYSLQ